MNRRLRVLVVEDSAADLYLLERALRRAGYRLNSECVSSPEAMCAALERRRWDLVISDFTLPGFSGAQAVELVQKRPAATPLIILTGAPEQAARELTSAAPIVAKGDWGNLANTIERVLNFAPPGELR